MIQINIKRNNVDTNSAKFQTLELAQSWFEGEKTNKSFGKNERQLQLLDLQLGKCKVTFGLRAGEQLDFSKSKITVATKHEKIAKKFFEQKAMAVDIIKLYGSIELAPLVGLCDRIS